MRAIYLLLALAALGACRGNDAAPAPAAWTALSYGAPQLTGFSGVKFASPQVGWVVGGYTPDLSYTAMLLTTRDGGSTWQQTYQVTPLTKCEASINSISLPSPTVGFAVTADGQILKSTR